MMFHRHPRLPIDSELKQSEADGGNQVLESKNHEAFIDGMLQVQEEIRAQACKNIEEAQQIQKEYYDRRHLPEVRNMHACKDMLVYLQHTHTVIMNLCYSFLIGDPKWNKSTSGKYPAEK